MDDLICALELLREKHRFGGYIHVKLVAGREQAQIERLTQLASRVSLNVEAPCGASLSAIAPEKSFVAPSPISTACAKLVVHERAEQACGKPHDPLHPGGRSGMTVQFVVGATPDTDRTILDTATRLSADGGVHHTHFSAFRPIRDTPMEEVPATPALREHRLYQADYLVRDYGFTADEVVYAPSGNLPLGLDPKSAWALAHPERFPIEIGSADLRRADACAGNRSNGGPTHRRAAGQHQLHRSRSSAPPRRRHDSGRRLPHSSGRRLQTARWTEQLGFWAPEDEVGMHHMVYEVSPGTFR